MSSGDTIDLEFEPTYLGGFGEYFIRKPHGRPPVSPNCTNLAG